MNLTNESKTLFIPLLAKAEMSKQGILLNDKKAEEVISKVDFDFKSLKQSKWLSMFLSLRASLIDELTNKYLSCNDNTTVIHLGCGLDSRCLRVKETYFKWYDIDFENVIDIRKNFYKESNNYLMIGSSISDLNWINNIEVSENILIIMEGLTMYLSKDEIQNLLNELNNKFNNCHLLFDAYTKKGVKASKIKNPVNQVGAKIQYGINNETEFALLNENLSHVHTYPIRKKDNELKGLTKFIFNRLYCGKISESIYKIYEFNLIRK